MKAQSLAVPTNEQVPIKGKFTSVVNGKTRTQKGYAVEVYTHLNKGKQYPYNSKKRGWNRVT